MVGVAQLVEHRIVAPEVAGSNPVAHPTFLPPYGNKRLVVGFDAKSYLTCTAGRGYRGH